MAMNKKEQAEHAALIQRVAELEALCKKTVAPERDLPQPNYRGTTFGYDFNAYTQRVYPVTSCSHVHYDGGHTRRYDDDGNLLSTHGGWSQGGRDLYSTPHLAWLALRAAVETEFATALVLIDKNIAKETR